VPRDLKTPAGGELTTPVARKTSNDFETAVDEGVDGDRVAR
jgi:hypothetical protein